MNLYFPMLRCGFSFFAYERIVEQSVQNIAHRWSRLHTPLQVTIDAVSQTVKWTAGINRSRSTTAGSGPAVKHPGNVLLKLEDIGNNPAGF